jgi:hypothetical protein
LEKATLFGGGKVHRLGAASAAPINNRAQYILNARQMDDLTAHQMARHPK